MHAQPHGPARGNWIWLATAVFSMTILAVVGLSYRDGAGRCPAAADAASRGPGRPAPTRSAPGGPTTAVATAGLALYYNPGVAIGSCELGPFRSGGLYASLPPGRYARGASCGSYVWVHGPRGEVLAEVVDLCPGCGAATVNLSETAFNRIADPTPGSAHIAFQPAVDPPLPGPLVIHVVGTAAPGLAVQIRNHGNPLTSVAVAPAAGASPGGAWRSMSLRPDDYWVLSSGDGPGRYDLRVTDDQGHQVLLRNLSLQPGATLRPHVWMYPATAVRPASLAGGRAHSGTVRTRRSGTPSPPPGC